MDEGLLLEVEKSGVKNLSGHITTLLKKDLHGDRRMTKREREKLQRMMEELESIRKEWFEYLKQVGEA